MILYLCAGSDNCYAPVKGAFFLCEMYPKVSDNNLRLFLNLFVFSVLYVYSYHRLM